MPYYTVEELKGRFAKCEAAIAVINKQIIEQNGIAAWLPRDGGEPLPVTFRSVLREANQFDQHYMGEIPGSTGDDYNHSLCLDIDRITPAPLSSSSSDHFYPPPPSPKIVGESNAGKWPYKRGDPRDRVFIDPYKDPYRYMRDPYWLPQRDRCRWSLEIVREYEVRAARSAARFAKFNEIARERRAEREAARRAAEVRLRVVMAIMIAMLMIGLAIALFLTLF